MGWRETTIGEQYREQVLSRINPDFGAGPAGVPIGRGRGTPTVELFGGATRRQRRVPSENPRTAGGGVGQKFRHGIALEPVAVTARCPEPRLGEPRQVDPGRKHSRMSRHATQHGGIPIVDDTPDWTTMKSTGGRGAGLVARRRPVSGREHAERPEHGGFGELLERLIGYAFDNEGGKHRVEITV